MHHIAGRKQEENRKKTGRKQEESIMVMRQGGRK